jgi:hypothetical protein
MMKSVRMLAIAAALLAAPATLQAQDGGVDLAAGVKAGVNIATLSGEGDSPGRRTAFLGGGFLTISLANSIVYFQPELLYSLKGFKESEGGTTGTLNLKYLDLPLLVGVGLTPASGKLTPRFFVGPQVSFQLGCDIGGSEGGISGSIDCDDSLLQGLLDTKSVIFDLLLGIGADIDVGKLDLVIDARYDLGLTDVLEAGDSKMSAWQFLGGVAFPLGN